MEKTLLKKSRTWFIGRRIFRQNNSIDYSRLSLILLFCRQIILPLSCRLVIVPSPPFSPAFAIGFAPDLKELALRRVE
jgi:hypothetical protein